MPRKYKPTGNPCGRPKGSQQKKLTAEQAEFAVGYELKPRPKENVKSAQKLKERLAEMLCSDEAIEEMFEDLKAIKDPKERCAMRRDLYQYILPKVTAVDMNASIETDTVSDELAMLTRTTVMEGALGVGESAETPADQSFS